MTLSPLRLALCVLLAGLLVWAAFDWVTDQRDDARRERDSAQFEANGLREAARISGEMLAERDAIDLQNTTELNHVRTENQDLRRAVDAGAERLLIKAACPAVPADSGASRLADAGTAELAADARSDYFTLRDQLALSRQMVLGLQQHIVRVCQR
ncbi:lysis system i-spanin subunit Rz [Pseudomonas sp. SG20052]|uniref:lysis system i-spanin subunit Rz n=1 Tax=Pseudomonas sp. SG20052 TaxID=3074147 RepID=UPI00287FA444|nr:lysis system i-spanin subunit Rz [Pseudomonas sp. SG20052]WNF56029.1 lysis system i-spanin subunit Rz [Pseudomonas sp. SG20052]